MILKGTILLNQSQLTFKSLVINPISNLSKQTKFEGNNIK